MNRDTKSTLGMATAAAALIAAAAIASGDALADGTAMDNATSAGTVSPAAMPAQTVKRSRLPSYNPTEWDMQQNPPLAASTYTRAQARADYTANREAVRALTSEDGGSSYTWRLPPEPGTNLMGGPPASRDTMKAPAAEAGGSSSFGKLPPEPGENLGR